MNRVYQIVENGSKLPLQFSSKALSVEGVFRSFQKKHFNLLKAGTIYNLYVNHDLGFQRISVAYWNGKAFIKLAFKPSLKTSLSLI